MDLTIEAKTINVETNYSRTLTIELTGIKASDLNTEDVAKCVDFDTFFDAHDEEDIKRYINHNYGWYDE